MVYLRCWKYKRVDIRQSLYLAKETVESLCLSHSA